MEKLSDCQQIDQLRFRLFEVGIQLSEGQAEFEIAKAHQLMQKLNQKHYVKTAQAHYSPTNNKLYDNSCDDKIILKHALSMSYKAYTPSNYEQNINTLSHIELEQLVSPTASQTALFSKNYPFEIREFLQYHSQFTARISLLWCAIHLNQLKSIDKNYIDYLSQHFPQQMMQWHSQLHTYHQSSAKEYVPLILHPWQYKYFINKYLKEALHQKNLLGPLTRQAMHPCFDPSYLISPNPNAPIFQTNLFHPPENSIKHHLLINTLLNKHQHFNNSFFCLFNENQLNIKHSHAAIQTNFLSSPYSALTTNDRVVPLNSLLNPNYLFTQPLLINMLGSHSTQFHLFFKSLLQTYLKTHLFLFKNHHLLIASPNEHLLLVINNNQVHRVIHRAPSIKLIKKPTAFVLDAIASPLQAILDCYVKHTGDRDTYLSCQQILQKQRIDNNYME